MPEKKKYGKTGPDDFIRYIGDQMSESERNDFEKELEKDPFAAEALEGFMTTSGREAYGDLEEIRNKLHKRLTIKRRVMINRMTAAAAAVLIAAASLLTVYHDRLGLFPGQVSLNEPVKEKKKELSPGTATEKEAPAGEKAREGSGRKAETVANMHQQAAQAGASLPDEAERQASEQGPDLTEDETLKPGEVAVEQPEVKAAEQQIVTAFRDEVRSRAPEDAATPVLSQKSAVSESPVARPVSSPGSVISGKVVSAADDRPLNRALVSVKGTGINTLTDSGGHFEIPGQVNSGVTLVAGYIGMETGEASPVTGKKLKIALGPASDAANEVIISGTGMSGKAGTGPPARPAAYNKQVSIATDINHAEPLEGMESYSGYIRDNIKFPPNTGTNRAVVVLGFVVDRNGRPEQVAVLESPRDAFASEATRLLVQGPSWKPSLINGTYFPEETRIRIVFSK